MRYLIWTLILLGCSDSSGGAKKSRPQPDDARVPDNGAVLEQRCKQLDYDACQTACEHNEQRACVVLGEALMEGRIGVMRDERGRQLLRAACERGAGDGCFVLAKRLMRDPGRDLPAARRYFARGCELEDWASCVHLADMLQLGRGETPTPRPRAVPWSGRAAAGWRARARPSESRSPRYRHRRRRNEPLRRGRRCRSPRPSGRGTTTPTSSPRPRSTNYSSRGPQASSWIPAKSQESPWPLCRTRHAWSWNPANTWLVALSVSEASSAISSGVFAAL